MIPCVIESPVIGEFSEPQLNDCNTTLTSTAATFTWSDSNPAPGRIYQPYVNGGVAGSGTSANSVSVTGLPSDGSTITKQIQFSDDGGATFQIGDTCTCTAVTVDPFSEPELQDCGAVLTSTSATFSWSDPNHPPVRIYQPYINGGVAGGITQSDSVSVTGLPSDGSTITKEIQYSDDSGATWQLGDSCTCTALTQTQNFSTPELNDCGTTLTSTGATFTWSDTEPAPGRIYQPYINGGVAGGNTTGNSVTVSGLPSDGSTITKEIQYSDDGGATFQSGDTCTCTATSVTANEIVINNCGQTLAGSQLTLSWSHSGNPDPATRYDFWLDTGAGFVDQGVSVQYPATSWPAVAVPTDGRTITKRLYIWPDGVAPGQGPDGLPDTDNFVECECTAADIQNLDHVFFTTLSDNKTNPDHHLDTDLDYLAEFLRQNPNQCAWEVDSGQGCIYKRDVPSLNGPVDTINSSAELQNALSGGAASNTTLLGASGTFSLPVGFNVSSSDIHVKDMTITAPSAGGTHLTINGQRVTFEEVNHDLQSRHMQIPIRINGDDCNIIGGQTRNLIGSGTGTIDAISVKANRANIICREFNDLWAADAVIRAIRWQGVTIEGGICANNLINNMQSTNVNTTNPAFIGDDADGFVMQQVNFTTPLYLLANRGINMGKRLIKNQSVNVVMLGNRGHWRDINGPLGQRRKRAIISDLFGYRNIVKNNEGVSDYRTTTGETYFIEVGHNRPQSGDSEWSCNVYEINHAPHTLDYFISVRNYSTGNPMYPPNSQMQDNVQKGSGAVAHAYWDRDTPSANNFASFAGFNLGTFSTPTVSTIKNT